MARLDKASGIMVKGSDGLKNFNLKRKIMTWSNYLILMIITINQKLKLTKMMVSCKWTKKYNYKTKL